MVWFILLQAREEKQGKQERQAKDNNGKARELVDVVVVVAVVVCFDVVVIFVSLHKTGHRATYLFVYYY